MRVVVDANLSPRVAAALNAAGHQAVHAIEVGLLTADDMTIASWAAEDERVVVTSDSDFGTILARTGGSRPSIVLLRHHNDATSARQADLILGALTSAENDLTAGCIATISKGRVRVRSLPVV